MSLGDEEDTSVQSGLSSGFPSVVGALSKDILKEALREVLAENPSLFVGDKTNSDTMQGKLRE